MSSKQFIGKILRLPSLLLPKSMVVPVLFGPLKGFKWIVGSSNHGCWVGTYEIEQSKQLIEVLRSLPTNSVFYDIGANVGYYSLLATAANRELKIYAFEPSDVIKYFKRHIELNNLTSVSLQNFAVGDQNRMIGFNSGDSATTGFVTSDPGFTQKMVKQISVDFWREENNIPPPAVIKMDIEGAEFEALLGMKETLMTFRPKIFLSTHGNQIRLNCMSFLKSLGYQIRYVSDDDQGDILATWL